MRAIASGDWHLTDNVKDEYRWQVFDVVTRHALDLKAEAIIVLGDISDQKDRHSSWLVNRMVVSFLDMAEATGCAIYIIKGNHDEPTGGVPYWEFLGHLRTARGSIAAFSEPARRTIAGAACWLVPHSRTPNEVWPNLDMSGIQFVFAHQTATGSVLSNGTTIDEGFKFPTGIPIISGDVHVPQLLGNVFYAGAPHPVRFGDKYSPRILYLEDGTVRSIPIKTISKMVLSGTSVADILAIRTSPGDQIKVCLNIPANATKEWTLMQAELQQAFSDRQVTLESIEITSDVFDVGTTASPVQDAGTPLDQLRAFIQAESITSELAALGEMALKGVL